MTAIQTLLAGLPAGTPAAVVIVEHRSHTQSSILDDTLAHVTIGRGGRFEYVDGSKIRDLSSSANPLFETASRTFTDRTIAVVLTGTRHRRDERRAGGESARTRRDRAGPAQRAVQQHARTAVRSGAVDQALALERIAPTLVAITEGRAINGAQLV